MAGQGGWPGGRWPGGSLCAGLGVVIAAAAAGCTGSPGGTGQGGAATVASPSPVFISRTVPAAGPGGQLTWFLAAVADVPLSPLVIRAHFDGTFLAQVSPDQLNSDLEQITGVPHGGGSLTGVLWQDPARDPVALRAVADFGGTQLAVTIAVDGAGLIDGLLLTRISPRPPAGPRSTGTLPG